MSYVHLKEQNTWNNLFEPSNMYMNFEMPNKNEVFKEFCVTNIFAICFHGIKFS